MPRPGVRPAPPAPALSRPKVGPRVVRAHSPLHNSCCPQLLNSFKGRTILLPPLLKGGGPPGFARWRGDSSQSSTVPSQHCEKGVSQGSPDSVSTVKRRVAENPRLSQHQAKIPSIQAQYKCRGRCPHRPVLPKISICPTDRPTRTSAPAKHKEATALSSVTGRFSQGTNHS